MRIPSPVVRRRARIEIIPLIDIMFFLLATFVMVSLSMVKNKGIAVSLPSAQSGGAQEANEYTAITITEKGELFFNKDLISLQDLRARLSALRATQEDPKVLVNGDQAANLGEAISVIDEVRKTGITKVSIRTKAPN